MAVLLLWILFVMCFMFVFVISNVSVPCSLVVTCWERVDLLALWYMMFSCILSPCGVLGQVWYLIISSPDFCLLLYFDNA